MSKKPLLGSARNTDLQHIPIGGVSHKVLHLARRPLMVVPPRAGSPGGAAGPGG